jgi:hypothetical protein
MLLTCRQRDPANRLAGLDGDPLSRSFARLARKQYPFWIHKYSWPFLYQEGCGSNDPLHRANASLISLIAGGSPNSIASTRIVQFVLLLAVMVDESTTKCPMLRHWPETHRPPPRSNICLPMMANGKRRAPEFSKKR